MACVLDWAAAGSWAQAVAGFAGVAALIWATKKGAETFGAWVQQRQAERRMAVAERLLTLAYRLDATFPSIRSPGSFGAEKDAANALLAETVPDFEMIESGRRHRMEIAQIILTRISQQSEAFDQIHAAMPEARAYFGTEGKAVLDAYWGAIVRVRVGAQTYPNINDAALASRLEADFWEGWGEAAFGEDKVGEAVKGALSEAERIFLPVLTSHL